MDNLKTNSLSSDSEPTPDGQIEPEPGSPPAEPQPGSEAPAEAEPEIYVNEKVREAFNRIKKLFTKAGENYRQSPRLQKVTYQRKFLPAFWTVACIFSLLVNVILLALLISIGHHFFELKAIVSNGLVNGLSNSLELMDKAHIVTSIPVNTTVRLQDNLPVVFDLPIDQNTQLSLTQDTRINGAYIYLNNASVPTDLTLPAGTPIQAKIDITIPVSQTVPVDLTVPVSLLVPLDLPVDETDLHQPIVGLQAAIEPYKGLLSSGFNSPKDISLCSQWWSGWICNILFGKQ